MKRENKFNNNLVWKIIFNGERSAEDDGLVETGFRQQICAVLTKPFSAIRMIIKDMPNTEDG